ncbi:MAG: hypothetical protein NT049_14745, partial [Planctomycetota bacterium]|nr:hypothetical protein [Planctomycetota bacterium]
MTTDQRIENLEKGLASARRLNCWLLAAVGLALGVWILAGTIGPSMAAAPAGDVRAKCFIADRFIVEDPSGIPRAILSADTTGPYLSLFDEKGNSRAQLSLLKGVPGLNLWDENNKFRAVLGVNKDGPTL